MNARMRWTFGLAAWLIASAGTFAQVPNARKVYTNQTTFGVPLKIEDGDRARISGVKCYVKAPGGPWQLNESAGAQVSSFKYHASGDGEYWFSFATVDPAGRETPARPDAEGPRLIVIVDTRAPEFAAAPVTVASGQTFVQCTMRDANPDPATMTAEAEQADGTFVPLLPLDKEMPGFFRITGSLPARVRVSGKDKAGNPAVQVISLAGSTTPTLAVPAPVLPPVPASPKPAPMTSELGLPKPLLPDVPAPVAPTRVVEKPPELPPANSTDQLVNNPRVVLNYAIDGVAPSAVTRVEAYATRDDGHTWQKLCEDPDRTSPIEIILPGDGRYGIQLMVSTAKRPASPPAPGEHPDWWVEVDTTPPVVTIEAATPGTGDEAGMLLLQWSVREKNPKPDSVEAFWANQPDGPWQPIAKGLRADGQYRWPLPREAGSRIYLKVEAQDRAGNVGRAVTPQAIAVELTRPRARVLGINPSAVRQ